MNINARWDSSFLFSSLNASTSMSGSNAGNFLADYASLKNGSYGRLMKAYYAKDSNTSSAASAIVNSSNKTSADTSSTLSEIKGDADSLQKSADKLTKTGTNSVFEKKEVTVKDETGYETTTMEYDKDSIYSAVSSFVNDYNSLLDSSSESNTASILRQTLSIQNTTKANRSLLSSVGITVGADNKLKIDKDKFMAANMDTVKTLFNGSSSYAGHVSSGASLMNLKVSNEISKAGTYNSAGSYVNSAVSGKFHNSYF